MTRYIAILSGKGGVGKTTTTINLATSLKDLKKNVVVVDTNLITPNVSLQLGLSPTTVNLNTVLKNKARVQDAMIMHDSGLKVVPAGLSVLESINNTVVDFKEALAPLSNGHDIVLLDCAAGLWGNISKVVKSCDEAIIVTNPELTALIDALKAAKMVEKLGAKVRGIVLNKVTNASYEVKQDTIESILNSYPIIAKIPFDNNVPRSISARRAVVQHRPRSRAARAYKKLAADLIGVEHKESFIDRVLGAF